MKTRKMAAIVAALLVPLACFSQPDEMILEGM